MATAKLIIGCWTCGKVIEVEYIGEYSHRQECPECQEIRGKRYEIMRANSDLERAKENE